MDNTTASRWFGLAWDLGILVRHIRLFTVDFRIMSRGCERAMHFSEVGQQNANGSNEF